jgi:hypothetical protein
MTKQTKTVKSYGTTSHAKRALKAIGTAALQAYDKLVTINEGGRFEFVLEKAEAIQDKADNAKQETYDAPKTSPKVDHGPSNRLIAAAIAKNPEMVASKKQEEFHNVTEAEHAEHRGEIVRESTVERPCKLVWHIADEMVGARRKDVLAVCVARGVAFYTARTQYQLWLSIKNGTAK